MKGFIELTPRYYDLGDIMMGIERKVSLGKPEMLNVSKIVTFGDGFIHLNPLLDTQPYLVKETYEEIKSLIEGAQAF